MLTFNVYHCNDKYWVLWKGVFFAVSGTEAQFLVDKVKGFADGAQDAAIGALKYAPLTPVQVGKGKDGSDIQGISFGTMSGVWDKSMRGIQQMQEDKTESLFQSSGLKDLLGGSNAAMEQLAGKIKDAKPGEEAKIITDAYEKAEGLVSREMMEIKDIDAVGALIERREPR